MSKGNHNPHQLAEKICPVCGRSFHWRKKWEKNWEEVVYCSDKCRKRKNLASNS